MLEASEAKRLGTRDGRELANHEPSRGNGLGDGVYGSDTWPDQGFDPGSVVVA